MMEDSRKVVVWVIDSLEHGGAELLLTHLLKDIHPHLEIHLVVLSEKSDFSLDAIASNVASITQFTSGGIVTKLRQVFQLRQLIKKRKPALVRSQLAWSNIIARLATPKHIPLFFSVHSTMSLDGFAKNSMLLKIEKATYKKRHTLLTVSKEVAEDYDQFVGIKGQHFVLPNFVADAFQQHQKKEYNHPIKMLACVGNLKTVKNYELLLETFEQSTLCRESFTVAIFGKGSLHNSLQKRINDSNLPITLKGSASNIAELLKGYDGYVLPSLHEGFGISVAEAMMVGLPLFVSDIDVMKETTNSMAHFFDPTNYESLQTLLERVATQSEEDHKTMVAKVSQARTYAIENYTKQQYITKLLAIYKQ